MHDEIRHIIEGTGRFAERDLIQTTLVYLRESQRTSRAIEDAELIVKKDEAVRLNLFAGKYKLWYTAIDTERYIGEGAEQQVYLEEDGKHVVKLNDTIFYESWSDYLISLLIHNYLFPNTAYTLLGFYNESDRLYAVVRQVFVESTEATDLLLVKRFLEQNGFINKRNNDYYNAALGIILEDLHDENVLTNRGVFFFIDTVIYLLK